MSILIPNYLLIIVYYTIYIYIFCKYLKLSYFYANQQQNGIGTKMKNLFTILINVNYIFNNYH